MTGKQLKDSLEERGVNLLIQEPFYGHILSGLIKVEVKPEQQRRTLVLESLSMTTIRISVRGDRWAKLDLEGKKRSLKKQLIHYIFMHPWLDKPNNIGLFYTACDMSANKYVHDYETLNVNNWTTLFRRYSVILDPEDWKSIYLSIESLRLKVNATLTDEEKFEFSIKALTGNFWSGDQLNEAIFFLPGGSRGSMNLSDVNDLVKSMRSQGASEGDISEAIKEMSQTTEDPWQTLAEGTSDLGAKNLIKSALGDAKMRGDIPGEMESYVDAFLAPPKIDWRSEARKFASLTGSIQSKTTMSRKSKRTGMYPSIRIVKTQKIAIIADSSGSVSDDEFASFFNEMGGLLRENCEIIFIQADAVVDQVDVYKKRLPEKLSINRKGYGGTAFGPALKFVRDQGKDNELFDPIGRVDGVIYMTDGHAPAPDPECYPNGIKMMWITTQKSVSSMESEGFLGKIVYLEVDPIDN